MGEMLRMELEGEIKVMEQMIEEMKNNKLAVSISRDQGWVDKTVGRIHGLMLKEVEQHFKQ